MGTYAWYKEYFINCICFHTAWWFCCYWFFDILITNVHYRDYPTFLHNPFIYHNNQDLYRGIQSRQGKEFGSICKNICKEDAKMVTKFERHLQQIEQWLLKRTNIDVLNIFYSDVIQNPHHYSDMVNRFLDGKLNVQKMAQAVER